MMVKLGKAQESVLRTLREHRAWSPQDRAIKRILDSLVKRGLVIKDGNTYRAIKWEMNK
jgi:hypothetical protein